ncbi:uncharacterized protein A1O5_09007 [Cladophialophora psammophila CBS 110553]|uniref:Heterokaryon incompatibility domain-containing protein n=1 Tax=Cladophialophora psammophila CBS 110553 TaxID=1182543 RepID=W9WSM3_9EURO|nr:uncharacterized protein A1O5_09007 [Cladophialophora psammophila CBS 110553]EXJ67661.1 hypothetical protein A1O5_09007 [Cladophialophora psammophila CBS 110553]
MPRVRPRGLQISVQKAVEDVESNTNAYDASLERHSDNPGFEGTTGVCDRCRRINWKTIWSIDQASVNEDLRRSAQEAFEPAPQKHGSVQSIGTGDGTVDAYSNVHWIVPVFDLGEVPAIDSQTCSLCSFLGSLAHTGTNDTAVERWYLGLSMQPLAPRHLYLVGRSHSWQRDTLMRGEVLYSEAAISKSTASSTVNDIPYKRLRVELDCCIQEIADDNETTLSTANIPDMLLINCHDRKIVPAPTGAVYMGLSYIWGPKQRSKDPFVTAAGEMNPLNLARTIEDAVTVTKELGLQYLWADRYCIDQTNPAHISQQLSLMHRIFKTAQAVIVALGDDDEAGLPGVASVPRVPMYSARTPNSKLLGFGPDLGAFYQLSHHKTRAWTFQESLLSTRMLCFTPTQVFLTCKHGSFKELLNGSLHTILPVEVAQSHGQVRSPLQRANLVGYQDARPFDLNSSINEYCSRRMTNEIDSLDAIKGYLANSGIKCVHGIPFYPPRAQNFEDQSIGDTTSAGACTGLTWLCEIQPVPSSFPQAQVDGSLCSKAPSWSWASCRPFAHYRPLLPIAGHECDHSYIIFSAEKLSLEDGTGKYEDWATSVKPDLNSYHFLHVTTRLAPFSIGPRALSNRQDTAVVLDWRFLDDVRVHLEKIELFADIRAPCSCHGDLNLPRAPTTGTGAIQGTAALLYIEKSGNPRDPAVGYWLALRQSSSREPMRRVGLIITTLKCDPVPDPVVRQGAVAPGTGPDLDWDMFREVLKTDMKADGHVGTVTIR